MQAFARLKEMKTKQKGAILGPHSLHGCRGVTSRVVCEVQGAVSIDCAEVQSPGTPLNNLAGQAHASGLVRALRQHSLDPRGRQWRAPTRQGLFEGAPTEGFCTGKAATSSTPLRQVGKNTRGEGIRS